MSLEPCVKPIPTIYKGEDKNLDFKVLSELTGDPIDISGASEIVAIFPQSASTFLEKKLSTAGIVLISGPGGRFQVQISAAESANLLASELGKYTDVEVHLTLAGKVSIIVFSQAISVLERRYPAAP